MSKHSRISPSSSKRWLKCPGSVKLLEGIPRSPAGDAAQQGTTMHIVSEAILLSQDPGADHKFWRKKYVGAVVNEIEITDDHMDMVLGYVDFCCEYIAKYPGAEVEVEHNGIWSENSELYGTIDLRISVANSVLIIIDLKTGRIAVDPETAPQIWIYALIAAGKKRDSFKEIHLCVYQPKDFGNERKVYIIKPKDLHMFADSVVKPAIKEVFSDDPPFHPGEEQCMWCDAAPRCKALAEFNINTAKLEFEPIDDILAGGTDCELINFEHRLFTNEQIGKLLPFVDLISKWSKSVYAYAEEELRKGRSVPGYKLVAGRSSRSWTLPEDQVVDYFDLLGVDTEQFFTRKMMTLPQCEKVLKRIKAPFDLRELTNKTPGNPKMAPESDKREAIKSSAAEDFKDS